MLSNDIWKGKRVLVTGHTGFKGSWLSIWLGILGADVTGYALEPYTSRDNFVVTRLEGRIRHLIGDVRDFERLSYVFNDIKPEIVFHLAAQPLVLESYKKPKETYEVNIGGTVNLLECCINSESVRVVVNVTSDKCYYGSMPNKGYKESSRLGGYDPYSSSKACSEIVTASYRNLISERSNNKSNDIAISSVRAGNVIGGGDWSNNRLIPDSIRALENNNRLIVRNPDSIRPWQHVLEPLSGYLILASKMYNNVMDYSQAWNFGPYMHDMKKVSEVVDLVMDNYGGGQWELNENSDTSQESILLLLDSSKSMHELDWKPQWRIEKAVEKTVDWYKSEKNADFFNLCQEQIEDYMNV